MSSAERSSVSNGIWLCRNHGDEVDDDTKHYTVETLRRLKREAEQASWHRVRGTPLGSDDSSNVDPAVIKRILQDLAGRTIDVEELRGPLITFMIGMKMGELREVVAKLSVPSAGEGLIDALRRKAAQEIGLGKLGSAAELLDEAGHSAEAVTPSVGSPQLAERWLEAARFERLRLRYGPSINYYERAKPHWATLDPIRHWTAVIEYSSSVYWRRFHENVHTDIDHEELTRMHADDGEAANAILNETRKTLSFDDQQIFNILFNLVFADHQVERYLHGATGLVSPLEAVGITAVEVALGKLCEICTYLFGEALKLNMFGIEIPLSKPTYRFPPSVQRELVSRVILRIARVLRILIEDLHDRRLRVASAPVWASDEDGKLREMEPRRTPAQARQDLTPWRSQWISEIDAIAEAANDINPVDLLPDSKLWKAVDWSVEHYNLEFE